MSGPSLVWNCLCAAVIAALTISLRADDPASKKPAPPSTPTAKALIQQYCIGCHNARLKTGGLVLNLSATDHIVEHPDIWEKVARKLHTGEMPPAGLPRPTADTYRTATLELESALDRAAADKPNPGRVPVHRLNRAEYANAIRDLLTLDIDSKTLLPADDSDQDGFDNVASILSVSQVLLENYLAAARSISRLAVGDTTQPPAVETYKFSKLLVQDDRMGDLPFGSQGGGSIRHNFPADGEYTIKVLLRRQFYNYIMGMGEPHQIDIRLDGVRLKRFTVGGEAKGMTTPEGFAGNTQGSPEYEVYMHTADAGIEVRVPVKAGAHEVSASFVERRWEPEGVLQPRQIGFARTTNENYHGNPALEFVTIGGPYEPAPLKGMTGRVSNGSSPSRKRIFVCTPKTPAEEGPCAGRILTTLARRAYRRPVNDEDVNAILGFYRTGRAEKDFDTGIRMGLERILAAPSFLFRVEGAPANAAAGSTYKLSGLDVASRLSFFLWSSVPDDALLSAAIAGQLRDPAVLKQQVRRMLRDPRSQALVDGFANRWLGLSKLAGLTPDTDLYREFDENLRDAMARETRLFVANQIEQDRSVADLVTANYTFVNERLAKHYGIPNIYGPRFRRVDFTDGIRGGLLGQASILSVTSYPNRTSVTVRGRWLLTNLFGAPPPPPPPNVPALKDAGQEGQPRALRARMELHRKAAECASCHQRMDPLGSALENFDALGKWRTESDGAPIDAAAALPDGTKFDGVTGLRGMMATHREDFVRTFTEKLLAYAIGRGIELSDMPAVRTIAREADLQDNRWSAIIWGIVNSAPFNMAVVGEEKREQRNDRSEEIRFTP